MEPVLVKFKKLCPEAEIPTKANSDDVGFDLVATSIKTERDSGVYAAYKTGLAIELPPGYAGFLFPRSSISKTNQEFNLRNSVGVIDSGYRGEIEMRFSIPYKGPANCYKVGDRVGQLIILPYPEVQFVETEEELTKTERGEDGFGSSGK